MSRSLKTVAAFILSLGAGNALPAMAQPTGPAPVDYRDAANWLCRPGRSDACAVDQTATVVAPDGKLTRQAFVPAKNPTIDCFYVYPTVSTDPTPNSDMTADQPERRVVEQQLARFGAQCRLFAPLYRQATLAALRSAMLGQPMPADRELAYRDVLSAWNDYLARDNGGRGVVLIGHSQGAGILKRLIQEEVEGKPVQKHIVSALLIGTNVIVPEGADVGGDFKQMPLCHAASQTGCIVSYVSFRDTAPPPANTRFARATTPGTRVACVNPAAPGGGEGTLDAYLSNASSIVSSSSPPAVWAKGVNVDTPFVQVPGLLTSACVQRDGASYLAVTTHADPADPRADTIAGDVVAEGRILPDWGLHLIDMNVAMGNLVDLVGRQAKAYRGR